MALSYNGLWKLLIDKKMTKEELRVAAGLSPNTVALMGKDKDVSLATLRRICDLLNVNLSQVAEYTPNRETTE